MSSETPNQKVLSRIRKMLKLANDAGATEGERDNALRMVHNTLAKYNLSLAQAEAAGEDTGEKRGRLGKQFLGKPWCISIAGAIARMYFCHYFYQGLGGNAGPTQKANHVFVGKYSNATTAQEMAEFVVTAVNREAQRFQRNIGGRYSDYRAFAQGAMIKIQQRCADIIAQSKKQDMPDAAPGTALVLASLYKTEEDANQDYLKRQGVVLGSSRSQSFDETKRYAHAAGKAFGASVSLNNQVGGPTQVDPSRRLT